MKRALKHGMADLGRVKTALDLVYKNNLDRLAPYSPTIVWKGAHEARVSLTIMAKTIIADFTITADHVLVESKVPFLFSHFEGKVMDAIGEHLEREFSRLRANKG